MSKPHIIVWNVKIASQKKERRHAREQSRTSLVGGRASLPFAR